MISFTDSLYTLQGTVACNLPLQQPYVLGPILASNLQIRKLGHKDVKSLGQGHTADKNNVLNHYATPLKYQEKLIAIGHIYQI